MELDSSTETKFSRHLVLRLPGHAFATNIDAGRFVAAVLQHGSKDLLIKTGKENEVTSFVDTAVYSRNRHFRMAFSCKGGKAAVLKPTRRFAWREAAPTPGQVFLDTLVCRVDPQCVLLQMGTPPSRFIGGLRNMSGCVVSGPHGGPRVAWKRDGGDVNEGRTRMQGERRTTGCFLDLFQHMMV